MGDSQAIQTSTMNARTLFYRMKNCTVKGNILNSPIGDTLLMNFANLNAIERNKKTIIFEFNTTQTSGNFFFFDSPMRQIRLEYPTEAEAAEEIVKIEHFLQVPQLT
jgi:hypothetical protein